MSAQAEVMASEHEPQPAVERAGAPASPDEGPQAIAAEQRLGRPRRVVLVDDDQRVLDELRAALSGTHDAWETEYVRGGEAALAEFDRGPVDVIVTDMRMPEMNGETLLAHVQARSPETIRVVLSGHGDAWAVAGAAVGAHRFLAKPCSGGELTAMLERSFAMAELSEAVALYRGATAATSLPSCPGVYVELTEAIADHAAGAGRIARVIERDPAMTAKVLQLANSAFFGVGRNVTRVRDAVTHLGTDTLAALALSARAFSELEPRCTPARFSIDAFQRHSSLVARLAVAIHPDPATRAEALTAAVLHDIGVLVLLRDDPRRWAQRSETAEREGVPLHLVESAELGVDHGSVGGYLLSLWGLPHSIAEAVANHHRPGSLVSPCLDAVGSVHIADALAHESDSREWGHGGAGLLDEEYVETIGVGGQLEGWRELARLVSA
jgi:HD-like signal output (HDOD) protein/ActR/RegA family two-component response regulator